MLSPRAGQRMTATLSQQDLFKLLNDEHNVETEKQINTKVIFTFGPSCHSVEAVQGVLQSGASCARLLLGWGPLKFHLQCLKNLQIARAATGKTCAVMVETRGREIFVKTDTTVDSSGMLRYQRSLEAKTNDKIVLTTRPVVDSSADWLVPLDSAKFPERCVCGDTILLTQYMSSGSEASTLRLSVVHVSDTDVICIALGSAKLEGQISVTLVDSKSAQEEPFSEPPVLTPNDITALKALASASPISLNFLSLSHTNSAADIFFSSKILLTLGLSNVKILAKLETGRALVKSSEIMKQADGIILDSGKLSATVPPGRMSLLQKAVLSNTNLIGKPALVTSTAGSLISSNLLSRVDESDIIAAVMDGCDGIVLGSETHSGYEPAMAIQALMQVFRQAEGCTNNDLHLLRLEEQLGLETAEFSLDRMTTELADSGSKDQISACIVFCLTGVPLEAVGRCHLGKQVLVAIPAATETPDNFMRPHSGDSQACLCSLYSGMKPVYYQESKKTPEKLAFSSVLKTCLTEGYFERSHAIVVAYKDEKGFRTEVLEVDTYLNDNKPESDSEELSMMGSGQLDAVMKGMDANQAEQVFSSSDTSSYPTSGKASTTGPIPSSTNPVLKPNGSPDYSSIVYESLAQSRRDSPDSVKNKEQTPTAQASAEVAQEAVEKLFSGSSLEELSLNSQAGVATDSEHNPSQSAVLQPQDHQLVSTTQQKAAPAQPDAQNASFQTQHPPQSPRSNALTAASPFQQPPPAQINQTNYTSVPMETVAPTYSPQPPSQPQSQGYFHHQPPPSPYIQPQPQPQAYVQPQQYVWPQPTPYQPPQGTPSSPQYAPMPATPPFSGSQYESNSLPQPHVQPQQSSQAPLQTNPVFEQQYQPQAKFLDGPQVPAPRTPVQYTHSSQQMRTGSQGHNFQSPQQEVGNARGHSPFARVRENPWPVYDSQGYSVRGLSPSGSQDSRAGYTSSGHFVRPNQLGANGQAPLEHDPNGQQASSAQSRLPPRSLAVQNQLQDPASQHLRFQFPASSPGMPYEEAISGSHQQAPYAEHNGDMAAPLRAQGHNLKSGPGTQSMMDQVSSVEEARKILATSLRRTASNAALPRPDGSLISSRAPSRPDSRLPTERISSASQRLQSNNQSLPVPQSRIGSRYLMSKPGQSIYSTNPDIWLHQAQEDERYSNAPLTAQRSIPQRDYLRRGRSVTPDPQRTDAEFLTSNPRPASALSSRRSQVHGDGITSRGNGLYVLQNDNQRRGSKTRQELQHGRNPDAQMWQSTYNPKEEVPANREGRLESSHHPRIVGKRLVPSLSPGRANGLSKPFTSSQNWSAPLRSSAQRYAQQPNERADISPYDRRGQGVEILPHDAQPASLRSQRSDVSETATSLSIDEPESPPRRPHKYSTSILTSSPDVYMWKEERKRRSKSKAASRRKVAYEDPQPTNDVYYEEASLNESPAIEASKGAAEPAIEAPQAITEIPQAEVQPEIQPEIRPQIQSEIQPETQPEAPEVNSAGASPPEVVAEIPATAQQPHVSQPSAAPVANGLNSPAAKSSVAEEKMKEYLVGEGIKRAHLKALYQQPSKPEKKGFFSKLFRSKPKQAQKAA